MGTSITDHLEYTSIQLKGILKTCHKFKYKKLINSEVLNF